MLSESNNIQPKSISTVIILVQCVQPTASQSRSISHRKQTSALPFYPHNNSSQWVHGIFSALDFRRWLGGKADRVPGGCTALIIPNRPLGTNDGPGIKQLVSLSRSAAHAPTAHPHAAPRTLIRVLLTTGKIMSSDPGLFARLNPVLLLWRRACAFAAAALDGVLAALAVPRPVIVVVGPASNKECQLRRMLSSSP